MTGSTIKGVARRSRSTEILGRKDCTVSPASSTMGTTQIRKSETRLKVLQGPTELLRRSESA